MRFQLRSLLLTTTLIAFYAGAFGQATRNTEGLSLFGDGSGVTTLIILLWIVLGMRYHATRDGRRLLSVPLPRRLFWHAFFALGIGGAPLVMASSGDDSLQAKGGFAPLIALLVVIHGLVDRYNRIDFGEHQVRIGGDHFSWAANSFLLVEDGHVTRLVAAARRGYPKIDRVRWPKVPARSIEEVRATLEAKQAADETPTTEEPSV